MADQTREFPQPIQIGPGVSGWALSTLERFEAQRAGVAEPTPRDGVDECYLRPKQVAARYGVSLPTLWRWTTYGMAGAKRGRRSNKGTNEASRDAA